MSNFKKIQNAIEKQFEKMSKEGFLYTLNLEKDELWELYLASFPEGKNEIFRERREHDCSACRSFINKFGDVVAIINDKVVNLWDFEFNDDEYAPVIKVLSNYIKTKLIQDVYISPEKLIGIKENHEKLENGDILTWEHFNVTLPDKFVTRNKDSIATFKSKYRDVRSVFKRSLEEISIESVLTILELIAQNSLYKGEEWKIILTNFHLHQAHYSQLNNEEKEIWLWKQSTSVGISIGKIRNHSIGTLLVNITEGMDLDLAVKKYESIVAPTNYKRPKPIYTKAMLEKAKAKIEELGYMDSLQRRYAILEDVNVNNVLYANKDVVKKLQTQDVFAEMENDVIMSPKSFERIEEIKIDDFIKNVLPTVKNMEVYLEGRHSQNMVSLIAPYKADSKTMFKWNNNFSWAYTGNITDSDIKRNVKSAGGKVDGVLRFSIQWNDEKIHNQSDYDAHCIEPNGNEIYYSRKHGHFSSGDLDVDIIHPSPNQPAVENITWSNKNKMQKGKYKFFVHNYSRRSGDTGFRAEIEFNGQQYKFDYPKPLNQGDRIQVAEVDFDGENFIIKEHLSSEMSSKEVWNLKTNNFIPVSVMMYSPNYWDEQKGIGNKHFFFMLKDCINDENPNGFFNEFLNNELTEHRKVFEALGSKMKATSNDVSQLSGIGMSSTQRNDIIVRIEGQTKRMLKIKI